MSELSIGLTILAIGTSLLNWFTALIAAYKGEEDSCHMGTILALIFTIYY